MSEPTSSTEDLPWIIVGYGRVGQALGALARELGVEVSATWNRSAQRADDANFPSPNALSGTLPAALEPVLTKPALIWITVVDDAVAPIFQKLARHLKPGSIVVHTSGSLSSEVLSGHSHLAVASLHPLQAITDPVAAVKRFSQTYWTLEGDAQATSYLQKLLAPAGIAPLHIGPGDKVLYHASAVCAANLLVSLMDAAISMAEAANIDGDKARAMLVELARSSLENLASKPPKEALTGPAARGDLTTIERHKEALAELDGDPQLLEIYELLTRRALARLT